MKQILCALTVMVGLSGFSMAANLQSGIEPALIAATKKPASATKAPAAQKEKPAATAYAYQSVQPLSLLKNSEKWIGERVSFEGTFVTFSPLALDYDKAMRPSKDYISFLIQRPDVNHHTIPMSELKLIYPRKKADNVMDLGNGDKVVVKGKVFSAALGDPWVDVEDVVIVQKNPENASKETKKKNKEELE